MVITNSTQIVDQPVTYNEFNIWLFCKPRYPIGIYKRYNFIVRSHWPEFDITTELVEKLLVYAHNLSLDVIEITAEPVKPELLTKIIYENYENKLSNHKGY